MQEYRLSKGEGRTNIGLSAQNLGDGIIVCIHNENAHIGSVALAEYDHKENRTSTSVITRLGHKDDAIAQKAAHLISKHTKRPSCVIAGVHIERITEEEIKQVLDNAEALVKEFLEFLSRAGSK